MDDYLVRELEFTKALPKKHVSDLMTAKPPATDARKRSGWFRVWAVASALWIAATVGLQAYSEWKPSEPPPRFLPFSLESELLLEGWSDFQIAMIVAWTDVRPLLIVIGPPLGIPLLILLIVSVSRWVKRGFEESSN